MSESRKNIPAANTTAAKAVPNPPAVGTHAPNAGTTDANAAHAADADAARAAATDKVEKDHQAKTEVERLKAAKLAGEPASMEGGGTNTFMSSRTLPNNPSPGDPNPIFPDEGVASAEAERDLEARNRQARVTAAAEADAARKGEMAPNKDNL